MEKEHEKREELAKLDEEARKEEEEKQAQMAKKHKVRMACWTVEP